MGDYDGPDRNCRGNSVVSVLSGGRRPLMHPRLRDSAQGRDGRHQPKTPDIGQRFAPWCSRRVRVLPGGGA